MRVLDDAARASLTGAPSPLGAAAASDSAEHASAAGGSGADPSGYSGSHAAPPAPPLDTDEGSHTGAPVGLDLTSAVASGTDSGPLNVVAVIYVPDTSPEMVAVTLQLPCGVDQAVAQVVQARLQHASCGFTVVTPVSPQPCLEFLVMVASPSWLVDRPMVLIDCLRVNRTLFAKVLFPSATRETLLLAAGFRHDSLAAVFVHGLIQPLQPGQRIQLYTGMVVSLAPPGCGAPATSDLATRLQSHEGWDEDAFLPGPEYAPGMHYWILTDGLPTLFTVGAWRRQHAREDLARQLEARESFLVVRPTRPVVHDAFFNGFLTSGVWVATESLSRVPYPPARKREERVILVMDCRPILLGFRWLLLDSAIVPVSVVTGPFQELCPAEHVVVVEGADAIQWGNEYVFQVSCGQLVTVSFETDISPEAPSSSDVPPPDPDEYMNHDDPAGSPPHHLSDDDGRRNRRQSSGPRSRSPRQNGDRPSPGPAASSAHLPGLDGYNEDRVPMWRTANFPDVIADDVPSLTPSLPTLCPTLPGPVWLCCFSKRLLPDPALASAFAWHLHLLLCESAAVREALAGGESDMDSQVLVDLSFSLLAPDYDTERLSMQVLLPQTVADVLDLLDTCRGRDYAALFPRLSSVHPQPDRHTVHVIMSPSWAADRVLVCLDLSQCDGRIFAEASGSEVDSYTLLNMAGFSSSSLVSIFVPGLDDPLAPGEEVQLVTGDCISFVPPEASLRVRGVLQAMLSSTEARPVDIAPHGERGEDRFCLVADGFYFDFLLLPARSFLYREDVASRLQMPAHQLLFSPAHPGIHDAQRYGRLCRSVVAVGRRSHGQAGWTAHVGLLDCRPILEGWQRLCAPDGWLNLGAIRDGLMQGAPAGYQVCFVGLPLHWDWTWLEHGQVLRVTFCSLSDEPVPLPAVTGAPPRSFVDESEIFPGAQTSYTSLSSRMPASSSHVMSQRTTFPEHEPLEGSLLSAVRTWLPVLQHHACPPGSPGITSAVTLTCLCLCSVATLAVCVIRRHCLRALSVFTWLVVLDHLEALGVDAVQLSRARHSSAASAADVQNSCAFGLPPAASISRPIPTPCRGLGGVPSVGFGVPTYAACTAGMLPVDDGGNDEGLAIGATLLEKALWDAECPAFFLAATLVETLVEHFGTVTTSATLLRQTAPIELSLSALLSHPTAQIDHISYTGADTEVFDLTARQCVLPCGESMLRSLRAPLPFAYLQGPSQHLFRPERFDTWVKAGQPGRAPAPGEIVVLTADGSFDPISGRAGWGLVVSLVNGSDLCLPGQFVGCLAGSTEDLQAAAAPDFPHNNAYLAEVSGLLWSALLSLRLPHFGAWVIRADNVSALAGVAGTVRLQEHIVCRAAAAVHAALRLVRGPPTYQHVPGHSADPANELADALANHASRKRASFTLPGFSAETWFQNRGAAFDWLPHACLTSASPGLLPCMHDTVLEWRRGAAPFALPPADTMRPFLRAVEGSSLQGSREHFSQIPITLASFNALSLLEPLPSSHAAGLHGETGRVKLLCASLASSGVHLAGLQECRTPSGSMVCQSFHRFASGRDDNACYGVELWVSATGPFDPSSVTLLHAEPTFLVASLTFRGCPLRVLVAHGPDRVHAESFRVQWWRHVTDVCAAHHRDAAWIVLADANCRVGEHTCMSIGPHQADQEDLSGSFFRAFLEQFECWLPATFANTAVGPGGTLYQRRNGDWDRSDYVAIPSAWRLSHCSAWVESSISAGHQCLDHFAVVVTCSALLLAPARGGARAVRIDPAALSSSDNRATIEEVLSSIPHLPWETDASVHAAVVVDHMYRRLAALFPLKQRPMRGAHFSDDTTRLHQLVTGLRHSIRARSLAFHCTLVRCAFAAWRSSGSDFHSLFRGHWLWRMRIHHGLDCMLLRRYGRALRLIAVDMTAGREVSTTELAETCGSRQQAFEGTDLVDSSLVPTWARLQSAFKATAPHKACGPDMLPPVLCTLFSQNLTEVFWPIMLKAVLRANEAVGLKGGLLHRIAKPNAIANTTAGYRGILVQSCLSKVLHRAVRHMAVQHWDQHILPLQIGGRRGCPAAFGHFCSRAFLAMTRAKGQSAAILFVDIAAAYYGVIREAVLGVEATGRPLCELIEKLGLSDDDLQYLHFLVEQEPVLRQQGAADLFSEVANELHRSTWFVLAGDSCVVETHRGTRPGGSLADVIFSILFCKVLQRRPASACRPFVPQVEWSGDRSPWVPAAGPSRPITASDVVYADDLASFLICSSPSALPKAVAGMAADTIDTLLPHGLSANVGPTKTAAIAVPAGRGSREVRRRLFSEGKGRLVVLPETRGGLRLDLVTVYKHLGSIVAHDGSLMQEIKHRLAAGRSALKEGKQRLFACRAIPVDRRAAIFRSHVLSAITPGMGTWRVLTEGEWRVFSGGMLSMYRQLLCLRVEGGFRCTTMQIVSRVGLPSPEALLHVERLRFLGQLVRHGPDAAWALMGHYAEFKTALRLAASWLLAAVGSTCSLGGIEEDWANWASMMRDSPGRWKALLKRADSWHALCALQAASLDGFCRQAWEVREASPVPPIAACEHACLHCRIAFRTRQQWGAHAHRVHGYHSRAHMVAKGRTCQACGLQVATEAKLRTHLRLSLPCVQAIERLSAAGSLPVDSTQAHVLAPALPGIGKSALGVAAPEILSALDSALEAFVPPTHDVDEAILALVQQYTAPLPVLRCTLACWGNRIVSAPLRQACDDVLLVLHPEHLCDRVAGRTECATDDALSFVPCIVPPAWTPPCTLLPVLVAGGSPSAWFLARFGQSVATVDLDLSSLRSWQAPSIAGVCASFPPPPTDALPVFAPSSCSLRALRALRVWTDSLLSGLLTLFAIARSGKHVLARIPVAASAMQPLARWLSTMAGETAEDTGGDGSAGAGSDKKDPLDDSAEWSDGEPSDDETEQEKKE
ncbi:unnamed protein product, partial [Symbiodinium sp. KB8]